MVIVDDSLHGCVGACWPADKFFYVSLFSAQAFLLGQRPQVRFRNSKSLGISQCLYCPCCAPGSWSPTTACRRRRLAVPTLVLGLAEVLRLPLDLVYPHHLRGRVGFLA